MATSFTIYQLHPDDNIEALAIIHHEGVAEQVTNLLLEDGLVVWYEPDQFERDFKHMVYQQHLGHVLNGGG